MDDENLASNDGTPVDSLSSTPFVSAPSSPGRSSVPPSSAAAQLAYFFSAPASPTHFLLSSSAASSAYSSIATVADIQQADFEFGLAARSMSTAEELFSNGQIRPGFVSMNHASVPHMSPNNRRARSVSPTRNPRKLWRDKRNELDSLKQKSASDEAKLNSNTVSDTTNSNCVSTSTSRSSSSNSSSSNSSNASSRRWAYIKDLLTLQRSKSEGKILVTAGSRPVQKQGNKNICAYGCKGSASSRGRLTYSASFSPSLCMEKQRRPANKAESAHHVKDARRRTTFLPYKPQGFLFGCLGFSSRGFVRSVGIPTVVTSRHS